MKFVNVLGKINYCQRVPAFSTMAFPCTGGSLTLNTTKQKMFSQASWKLMQVNAIQSKKFKLKFAKCIEITKILPRRACSLHHKLFMY